MRFLKAPEELEHKWSVPLIANRLGKLCMPTESEPSLYDKKNMGEDCLFLNVYIPGIHHQVCKIVFCLLVGLRLCIPKTRNMNKLEFQSP